jgi:serine/threonine-protein kinase RsbW
MKPTPPPAPPHEDHSENSTSLPQCSVILPASYESLEQVREFVGQAAQAYGLDASEVYQVQLAVDEAFTNIIEHAYEGECLEDVECTCLPGEQDLAVVLRDCGKNFDPSKVPEPDLKSSLEKRKIGGLGLYLMRRMMDEVFFTTVTDPKTGKLCNLLRMVKRKEQPR